MLFFFKKKPSCINLLAKVWPVASWDVWSQDQITKACDRGNFLRPRIWTVDFDLVSWTFHMLIYDVVWPNFSCSLFIGLWGNGDQLTLSLTRRAEEEIVHDSVILSYQFCVLDLSAIVDHVRIILCLVQLLPCLCLIWSELKIRLNYYLNVHFPFT